MIEAHTLYERYQVALGNYTDLRAKDPSRWHRPDVDAFTELHRLMLPHAEAGDMHCQYALAGMHELGLCCDSEEEYMAGYRAANEMATRWWTMAAMQGLGPALDNLVTSGVGEEAERVRELCRRLEKDRPDLVGTSQGMPIYGPAFFQELHAKVFGPLKTR